uniref:secondary thiamine-phosphate synthase enzyme YjbQ n=1 Tax=Pseudemcibacter sp. TaxID=2943293 RepID=UPI003F6A5203
SLTIQENADPDVLYDLNNFFGKLVPENALLYRHNAEGADDMPAHIKSALTQTQLSIPIRNNDLNMGIWQGIYIFEHRAHAHKRTLVLHILGE